MMYWHLCRILLAIVGAVSVVALFIAWTQPEVLLVSLVEEHDSLRDQQRYGEAYFVAKSAVLLYPKNPVAQQLSFEADLMRRCQSGERDEEMDRIIDATSTHDPGDYVPQSNWGATWSDLCGNRKVKKK
jgi:hypothetical protein